MEPIHHMMAHFPIALLFLALLIILFRAFVDSETSRRIEAALPLLLVLGFLGGLAAFITGLLVWPSEAIVSSPMARNKLLVAAWMLGAWGVVTILRLKGGPKVRETSGRWSIVIMSLFGGGLLATTGTLGGYLLGTPSPFSVGLKALGWDVYHTFFSPTWALITAAVLAVLIILFALSGRKGSAN